MKKKIDDFTESHWYKCDSMCVACPFNMTEEQEMAYNLGCLPTPSEILEMCQEHRLSWSCHGQDGKLCAGFVAVCRDEGISLKGMELMSTETYLKTGKVQKIS